MQTTQRTKVVPSARQVAACLTPKVLDLTLLPTEKCNFRCVYCYEDFAIGRMKPHVVEGICNLVSARAPGLEVLRLRWFGGEPLLARPVIEQVAGHALELAAEHGFAVEGGLTTNGYLLDAECLARLVALRQDFFQISLDGWEDAHDTTRLRADGRGTFRRIWNNLLSARDGNLAFKVSLRVHVTPVNQDSVRRLCRAIHDEFGDDDRFRVDFQDVRDLGGDGAANVQPLSYRSFAELKRELGAIVATGKAPEDHDAMLAETRVEDAVVGESASSARDGDRQAGEPYVCYAARPNHMLVRADGRVGKCTVALDDDDNLMGHINPDGTVEMDQEKARLWYRGFHTLDLLDLGCPLAGMAQAERGPRAIEIAVTA